MGMNTPVITTSNGNGNGISRQDKKWKREDQNGVGRTIENDARSFAGAMGYTFV